MREPRRPHFKCKKLSSNIDYITSASAIDTIELRLILSTAPLRPDYMAVNPKQWLCSIIEAC
jgi:hypothetical protein